jgi:hypothetical protein
MRLLAAASSVRSGDVVGFAAPPGLVPLDDAPGRPFAGFDCYDAVVAGQPAPGGVSRDGRWHPDRLLKN